MKFFREILTVIACLLLVVLSAALAGPYFVDWKHYRTAFEERLSQALGLRAAISGDIELRLLPQPRLRLGGVTLSGSAPGFARIQANIKSVRLEIAPAGLMRGDLRFTDLEMSGPDVELQMQPEQPLNFSPAVGGYSGHIAFENLRVIAGRLRISAMPGGPIHNLENISLNLSALALAGPWRGDGALQAGVRTIGFHFNTGVAAGDQIRVKIAIDPSDTTPQSEFDGALQFGAIPLVLEGQARLTGTSNFQGATANWDLSGPLRADLKALALDPFQLRASIDERSFNSTGSIRHTFGAGIADITAQMPRLDADALFSRKNGAVEPAPAGLQRGASFLSAILAGGHDVMPARLSLATPALTLGGDVLADVKLAYEPQDQRSARLVFSSGLPGRASLALDGLLETGAAARFKGSMKFEARDFERFAQWLSPALPASVQFAAGLPFSRIDLDSDIDASAAGLFTRNLNFTGDRSQFRGLVNFTRPIGDERARLVLDLVSPALNLDHIPDLSPLLRIALDADLVLALDARAVRLARVGQGMIDAGRIVARIRRVNGALAIEQFDISNLGGANFSAAGRVDGKAGQLDVKLKAERLVELAGLLQRVLPGPWSDALAQRAVALSPALLSFSARAAAENDKLTISALDFSGTVRGTRIEGSLNPQPSGSNALAMRLVLANPQASMLMRQFGLDTIPLGRLPEGRIEVDAVGSFAKGFDSNLRATLAGTSLSYRGQIAPDPAATELGGELKIISTDATPLMQILALPTPDATARMPINLSGVLSAQRGRIELGKIDGQAFGSRIAGSLAFDAAAKVQETQPRLTGALRLDRLQFESLAALVLGPPPPVRQNAIWPDFKFAPMPAGLPRADIRIAAANLGLPGGTNGEDAKFRLGFEQGVLSLDEMAFGLAGGSVSGKVALRRDGANASASGVLGYDGPLVGGRDFSGLGKARLEFGGTGASYAAMIGGLAGRGLLEASAIRIAAADPAALSRVIAEVQDRLDVTEAQISAALARGLTQSDQQVANVPFTLSLTGGRLQMASREGEAQPAFSATLDLRTLMLDAVLGLSAQMPEGWEGQPPEAALRWQGPLQSPKRILNVAALANALSARAIERESARIEMLEFDARERAAFNRRNRAAEFLQQRESEIVTFKADVERKQNEEHLKQEEEARRKLLEEQRALQRKAAADAEREKKETVRPVPRNVPRDPVAGAPLQLAPQTSPSSSAPRSPAPLSDPAASGRY